MRRRISSPLIHALLAAAIVALAAAVAFAGSGVEDPSAPGGDGASAAEDERPPSADAPLPRRPAALAADLTQTTTSLRTAIERWRAQGDPGRARPPRDVTLLALRQQRIYLFLGARVPLARRVLTRLPRSLRPEARDILVARRALGRLNPPTTRVRFRTGRALPADRLRALYDRAQRRFGVGWEVLAAVNFVETGFNRIRSNSSAGAQGPMQFIPSTWRAYGMGGNIRDPRDAILGAANYLSASGAPGDYRGALFAYNPSSDYVRTVQRYTRRIRRDARAYYALYSWQIFVSTPSGARQLTGPGRD